MERRSRTTLHGVSVGVALGLSLVVLSAACACSISSSDKAGGTARTTTVLTMANGNVRPQELQLFADQVASRSAGSMRITFRNEWVSPRADYKTQLIRDVDAGEGGLGLGGDARVRHSCGHELRRAARAASDRHLRCSKGPREHRPKQMFERARAARHLGLGVLPGPIRSHWAFQDRSSSPPSSKG